MGGAGGLGFLKKKEKKKRNKVTTLWLVSAVARWGEIDQLIDNANWHANAQLSAIFFFFLKETSELRRRPNDTLGGHVPAQNEWQNPAKPSKTQ